MMASHAAFTSLLFASNAAAARDLLTPMVLDTASTQSTSVNGGTIAGAPFDINQIRRDCMLRLLDPRIPPQFQFTAQFLF